MAGVKPYQYLIGVGGGTVTSIIFALIGDFTILETLKFLVIMITGTASSIILGAAIGMLSKNQQVATALAMLVAIIIGFTPMVASFNETIAKFAGILYTQQINIVVNDFSVSLIHPLFVIITNITIFAILFVIVSRKKGLKGYN